MVTSEGNAMANTSAMHLALQEVSWLIPLLWQPECWDLNRKIHSRCVCVCVCMQSIFKQCHVKNIIAIVMLAGRYLVPLENESQP